MTSRLVRSVALAVGMAMISRAQGTSPQALDGVAVLPGTFNSGYWTFGGVRNITVQRLDPILNPGTVGMHVHSVAGASGFSNTYDQNTLMQSKCTTVPVQGDKSNYWMPTPYYKDQKTHQYTVMNHIFNIYYQIRAGDNTTTIFPFPAGLKMYAGDAGKTGSTYNNSSFADQAVSFHCLGPESETPSFPLNDCPGGLRLQVYFPSCGDGRPDSDDHKSHMAYPIQAYDGGDCPASHPKKYIGVFLEMFVAPDPQYPWWHGGWVLSNGDNVGYSLHADFTSGWDSDLLKDALTNCQQANGDAKACAPFSATFHQATADDCSLEKKLENEDVGLGDWISALPGCNPEWVDGKKPGSCDNTPSASPTSASPTGRVTSASGSTMSPSGSATSPFGSTTPPSGNATSASGVATAAASSHSPSATSPGGALAEIPPNQWTNVGCIVDPQGSAVHGRALTGKSLALPNMTIQTCTAFCEQDEFTLAGIEYGQECYCDNVLQNSASMNTASGCDMSCGGDANQVCGGNWRLSLFSRAASGSSTSSSTSGADSTVMPRRLHKRHPRSTN